MPFDTLSTRHKSVTNQNGYGARNTCSSQKKSEELGLVSADLVLDHAIYVKALEVLVNPLHQNLRGFINLRMGDFHACCIFLAVIAKRFSAAGLKYMIIEGNLVGSGAVESIIRGMNLLNLWNPRS